MANYISSHTGAQIDAAVDKAHSHANKALLDSIPASGTTGYVLTKTSGGTAWAPSSGSGSGVNIQGGRTSAEIVMESGKTVDVQITFPIAFQAAPAAVMCCFETASTAGSFGRCTCAVLTDSVTRTGCTIRCFNGDSASRRPYVRWMAYGV